MFSPSRDEYGYGQYEYSITRAGYGYCGTVVPGTRVQ
jgi:hypothetical protein